MLRNIAIEFIWIPHELGGHRAAPWQGMRPTIRWQRYLREHLDLARDVECTSVSFDQTSSRGSAAFRFNANELVPREWLSEGSLIELLDGYRVIAVGRIVG
jgi:hypothetical protein